MKKITLCLMATCLLLTIHPQQSNATGIATPITAPKAAEAARAKALLLRLNEINEMDKSNLKPVEKKNLRIEVRSIKQELKAAGGGIYLSVGAIIIILLILILL